ncbi:MULTISPECIES: class I SAM-dependent methyltransferase [Ruegeria]|uniref:class I SAM-dependent methyltransferase n=1 Tax=Ruegeria TaxID=97050 RepID=UPI00147D5232|nr:MULTISPECIES: class I SAM-dependent methyltransferase [Ruegeria]MBO9411946.1 class I SAM-dependent methyltransferase [Ruegeria sp. R8_1]MBO9417055.1 class I SAM-dependent methyltransferase [Ruegeria sp. R8_2]
MTADPQDTHAVYERQATEYDKRRSKALFEARWLARFTASLKPGDHVLDLGCGTGDPIARWFMAEGFDVTGVDFSKAMLAIARDRWPDGDWLHSDMRDFDLGRQFDGIIAWNSFFHLTAAEQKACIARMARHLRSGGMLMLTVGPRAGEASGTVGAEMVYHASLSPAGYAGCLEDNGLQMTGFLAEDPETQSHTVLMARKL